MKLYVCLDGKLTGTLEMTGARFIFAYTEEWLETPGAYPLSQSLPLRPTQHTGKSVANYLWGLLPDNELTLASWARHFQVSARNPVALLSHVGEDCAGAVQFLREDRLEALLSEDPKHPEIEWLTEKDVAHRMRHLIRDAGAARESIAEGQFSLSGAQAKTAYLYDPVEKRWGIPKGRTPTTHILKPVANDFDGFAENEHFCLALARSAGLSAARTDWHYFGGVPTLVAERYDRVQIEGLWHRIHQEDCCQALGISPASKYESDKGPGFKQIMSLLDSSDNPQADRERLMKSACFVYLLAATDAHAKNFSLLYTRGTGRFSMRLSPLYDVASAWPYPRQIQVQNMKLAMQIGRHYRLKEIQPRHFEELAKNCGFSPDSMLAILQDMASRLPQLATEILQDMRTSRMVKMIIAELIRGLTAQCQATTRTIGSSP
jgi:serine/threonine-protein kinase HipA